MNTDDNNDSTNTEKDSKPMSAIGWVLVGAAVIGIVISLIIRFKVSGFPGFY